MQAPAPYSCTDEAVGGVDQVSRQDVRLTRARKDNRASRGGARQRARVRPLRGGSMPGPVRLDWPLAPWTGYAESDTNVRGCPRAELFPNGADASDLPITALRPYPDSHGCLRPRDNFHRTARGTFDRQAVAGQQPHP